MGKLYFKKFFLTVLFFVGFLFTGFVVSFVWHLVFRNLFSEQVRFIVVTILAALVTLKVAYDIRRDRDAYKSEFLNSTDAISIPFWKDFWAIIERWCSFFARRAAVRQ